MSKPKLVTIEQTTLDFYIAECNAIHALCDRAAVPAEDLSMSQRVAVMEGVLRELVGNLGKQPPVTIQ